MDNLIKLIIPSFEKSPKKYRIVTRPKSLTAGNKESPLSINDSKLNKASAELVKFHII